MPRHSTETTRTCAVCQKPYLCKECPAHIARGGGKFCSRACQGLSKRIAPADKFLSRICPVCQTPFLVKPSEVARGHGKLCSRKCRTLAKFKPQEDRFWAKVNKDGPIPAHRPDLGPCWIWTAASSGGKWKYGTIGVDGSERNEPAHRVSWRIHNGPVPEGMKVLHRCDNPSCVRPDHLFLGTLKDNTQDMIAKERQSAKLTKEQVLAMRSHYESGGITQKQLATEYGVSHQLVWLIMARRVWKHC